MPPGGVGVGAREGGCQAPSMEGHQHPSWEGSTQDVTEGGDVEGKAGT